MDIKNKFKAHINSPETQYGIWNGIADGYAAEIVAGAGFDWVLIDGEHAPFDLKSIIVQLQAMSKYDVTPLVRPPSGDPVLIKQLMDAGVQTLLVPMIETKEQTELMVKAMRYPPEGMRGVGTALARAAQWNRVNDYFKNANDEMCLIVQVESAKGYEALDDILTVKELDGVFIGPADLAASMGYLGQATHPEVVEKVKSAMAKIRAAGKMAGTLAVSEPFVRKYESAGANMIGLGIDLTILAKATKALAETFKPELKEKNSNTTY